MNEKRTLRLICKKIRNELKDEYKLTASKIISDKLETDVSFKAANTIMFYYPTKGEVNIMCLINKYYLKKNIVLPTCISKTNMIAREYLGEESLELDKYNIMTPKESCKELLKEDIDLIIVPCLGCDIKGHRLGHGNGYYDNFLKDYQGTTIMLSFKELCFENIPVNDNDIDIKKIITN